MSQKRLPFEVKRYCHMFEFECLDFQMSSFGVIYLAEQISINLQYMVTSLKVYLTSRVFALLFKFLSRTDLPQSKNTREL